MMNKDKLCSIIFLILSIVLIFLRYCNFSEMLNFVSLLFFVISILMLGIESQNLVIEFIYDYTDKWGLSNFVGSVLCSTEILIFSYVNYILSGADKSEMSLYGVICLGALLMACFRTLIVSLSD